MIIIKMSCNNNKNCYEYVSRNNNNNIIIIIIILEMMSCIMITIVDEVIFMIIKISMTTYMTAK